VIVTIEIPAGSKRLVERDVKAAAAFPAALARGVFAAADAAAASTAEDLIAGRLGLVARHGGAGLAGDVTAWMLDADLPLAAVGVPANTPGAAYARILERGGVIRPRRGRALSIPISEEAKRYASPREMSNLFMLKRPGRPPLLAEAAGRGGQRLIVHWVLVRSVTIRARRWLSRGVEGARPKMRGALAGVLGDWIRRRGG